MRVPSGVAIGCWGGGRKWSIVMLSMALASILPDQITAFTTVYNRSPEQGRRFGGYRIVPKACKDVTSGSGKVTGVCMFNYECSQKNGTVVGSCMDGFLFGACCRLPSGINHITATDHSSTPSSSTLSTNSVTQLSLATSTNVAIHGSPDTVLLHENGTEVSELYRPEDFEFNSNPELFLATEEPPSPLNRYSTTKSPQKSTTWHFLPSMTTTKWDRPATNSWTDEDNMVPVETIPASSVGNEAVHLQSGPNPESINHILNILNHSNPVPEPEPEPESHVTSTTTKPTLSTWVSVESKPPEEPTYYSSSTSSGYHYSTEPSFRPKPSYPPTHKPVYSSSLSYSSSTKPSSSKPVYISSSSSYPTSPRPSYTASSNPGYQISTKATYSSAKPSYSTRPKPAYSFHTTPKPSKLTTKRGPPVYTTLSSTHQYSRPPSTTLQYVVGPSFHVTPEPTTNEDPVPTVIVLAPVTKKPLKPSRPTIIVNTEGNLMGYKPNPAATVRPIYTDQGLTASPPLYTSWLPPATNPPPKFDAVVPVSPATVTHIVTQTEIIPPSTELLVAFPPDRDPNVNLTAQEPHRPEVISWATQQATTVDDVTPPPVLLEDQKFDNKVHKFVEKIVQSLQGNFVDLENVLLDGYTGNATVPTKKPVTTKRPPVKRPTKKPSPPPLITRPPPRPSTSPQITTVIYTSTSTATTTKKPPPRRTYPPTTKRPQQPSTVSTTIADATVSLTQVDYRKECGVRPLVTLGKSGKKNGRIVGGKGATFGEWPWQVLVREATWLGLFSKNKCGGVLITSRYVITAAHCQPGFLASLVAVFGEYDISGDVESKRSVTKPVRRVIVHRYYDAGTFENDIALLELESPVQFDEHIVPICMPKDDDDFTGKMATVTGWGRLKYGGGVPSVLQEVQVPVIENNVCQEMFHTAGHSKTILNSFICAGYAHGQRDSCEGDSGGPLMMEREDGHWVLAGTVSHGIKCAAPYLPGVYMRTTYYKPWLQAITAVKDL